MRRSSFVLAAVLSLAPAAAAAQQASRHFGGYPCQADCRAHASGFRWAQENRITDPQQCTGNVQAFREGCRVYTRDRLRGAATDDEGRPIR